MPELPDLEYIATVLGKILPGREIVGVRVKNPVVLRVRNRKGQPCPRCAAPIRVEGVRGLDACYCPTCQPNRPAARLGRRQLVDWSRLAPQEPHEEEE